MSAIIIPGRLIPTSTLAQSDTRTPVIAGTYDLPGISCDTVADLPTPTYFDGLELIQDSYAHIVEDNTIYCLKSSGTWIQQDEASRLDVYTKAETDAAIDAAIDDLDAAQAGGAGKYIKSISQTDGIILPIEETLDTVPTQDSLKAITSDAVYTAIDTLQSKVLYRGTRIPTNGDCNSLSTNGAWYAESATHAGGISNAPFTASGFLLYQQSWYQAIGSTVGLMQTAESIQSNTYYQRKRFYIYASGSWNWTSWNTIITQAI